MHPTMETETRSLVTQDTASNVNASQGAAWFETFAKDELMPRLQDARATAERQGARSHCEMDTRDGKRFAELLVVPPGLPAGARPPHLSISATKSGHRLEIDITGTFPHAGASGGFGTEIDYDTIYPEQVQNVIDEFIEMARA